MNITDYDTQIQELKEKIQSSRLFNPAAALQHCQRLLEFANTLQDDGLFGYAYYYMSEAHFYMNDYKTFMTYLTQGIPHQQRSSQGFLLARSYNMLAINAANQGNTFNALEYYLTAHDYCKEYDLSYETGIVYTNLGELYMNIQEYSTAIEYFKQALPLYAQDSLNMFYWNNVALNYAFIGDCYYRSGDYETAVQFSNQADECPKESLLDHSLVVLYAFRTKLLITTGAIDEGSLLIERVIDIILKMRTFVDIYDQIFDFCDYLLSIEKYEQFWIILTRIDALTLDMEVTNLQLILTGIKIKYYKLLNDNYSYLQASAKYYELSQLLKTQKIASDKDAFDLRFLLEDIRKQQETMKQENAVLQEHSMHDALTGLPNRYMLNTFSEEAFTRAYNNKTYLGVEIFDLDYFKQYNDTYGHQAGDVCLCAVANILKEMMCDTIFCARYGGDEFVIIYENKTDDEILALASQLRENVMGLSLEHKNSSVSPVVTISQGIRNSVPIRGNKMWDFLFSADSALYHVKCGKRNEIRLVHHTNKNRKISGVIRIEDE